LDSADALARHLQALLRRDARLRPVYKTAWPFESRQHTPGIAGMTRVICGQQLSVSSASASGARLAHVPGALEPEGYLKLTEEEVRGIGFSLGKFRTVRALAEAYADGFDLAALEGLPAAEAIRALCGIKGIGPWTAEIYLMFCAGHPDIFPAGDLA